MGPSCIYSCVCKAGVLFVGVLVVRALLFGLHIEAPDFWNLPYVIDRTPNKRAPLRGESSSQRISEQ